MGRLLTIVLLSTVLLGIAAAGGLAAEPTIEATGSSFATYAWTPSAAEVDSGGTVAFKHPTPTPHGLAWESAPETPSCTGTSSVGAGNWSGSCSFEQGGTYAFYCPVHPSQMRGMVTVSGPAAPLVSTGSANGINETEATLHGTVNPSEQETTYFFEYGTTTAYGQKTTEASAGAGAAAVPVSAPLGSLSPGTTYHFRLVAGNGTGTKAGLDRTFTTTAPPGPEPPPTTPPPTESPGSAASSEPTGSTAPPSVPATPPDTKLTLKPHAKTRDRTPTVRFAASVPGATFRCSLDGKRFKACRSPYTTPSLKPGRHAIRVTAVANGLTDPTPAGARFKVVRKKQ